MRSQIEVPLLHHVEFPTTPSESRLLQQAKCVAMRRSTPLGAWGSPTRPHPHQHQPRSMAGPGPAPRLHAHPLPPASRVAAKVSCPYGDSASSHPVCEPSGMDGVACSCMLGRSWACQLIALTEPT